MIRSAHESRSARGALLRALTLCAAAAPLAVGCQTQPRIVGANVLVQPEGRLAAVNPTDIAVAPIEWLVPGSAQTELELRRAAVGFLPRKRYSPLRLENVDGALVGVEPASYRAGTLREDAVLELIVHAWDTSLWSSRRSINVDLEARFVDPAAPLGDALWSGRLSQRFDFSTGANDSDAEGAGMAAACERVVAELLSRLPARDVNPAPGGALN
ncbi:MAG: hypothetical protein R3F49_09215 [Planctomycetota bacterium]